MREWVVASVPGCLNSDPADKRIGVRQLVRDYEVLAASHMERAPLGATHDHVAAASAFTAMPIVLREVADALDEAA